MNSKKNEGIDEFIWKTKTEYINKKNVFFLKQFSQRKTAHKNKHT